MSMRCWAAVASLVLLSSPALAEEKDKKAADPAPVEKPAADLSLTVEERGPGLPWKMTVANKGDSAQRIVADPRLLWFEVRVPGKKKLESCKLPDDQFPKKPDKRTHVTLEPGEGVEQTFDPRLYCFAAGGQWQLVPGTIVTPHFGWPEKKKTVWRKGKKVQETPKQSAPFVVQPPDAKSDDAEGAEKELVAEPFALRSDYARWARKGINPEKEDDSPIVMTTVQGSDAQAERTATVSVTVKNRSKETQTVYFRRELVKYEVMRPDGLATCDPQPDLRAPDRQAFARLGPGRSISVTSRLVELCPTGTFDKPGLYLVHARFQATETGEDFKLDSFVGEVLSRGPATVRIRTGEQPLVQKKKMKRVKLAKTDK
jgi:hypothetical protein